MDKNPQPQGDPDPNPQPPAKKTADIMDPEDPMPLRKTTPGYGAVIPKDAPGRRWPCLD